jgi:DNA-binding IclR family transcriptional regulator
LAALGWSGRPEVIVTMENTGLLGSVQRALRVLEAVAAAGDGVTAKAVARRTGYKLSTTYHLLNTLVHDGYLVRLNNARGYGLGYKISELNAQLAGAIEVTPAVADLLQAVHRQAGAAVYYAVFRDGELVVAEVADSPAAPRAQPLTLGFRDAPHATAFGKVLMAAMPERDRRDYLAGTGLPRLTPRTVTRLADLEQQLDRIRATGIGQEVEEFIPDLACVAAPVTAADGSVRGALSLSVPAREFTRRRGELARAARSGAARVSRALSSRAHA